MAGKIYLAYFCVIISASTANCLETVNGRIKITIGTTSGCINTVNFIKDQLVPAYAKYGDFLDIEFVPWGRTVKHDNGSMTCQFGPDDCWANRLHRCILNSLKENQKLLMDYMACEFTLPYPAYRLGSYKCVLAAGISVVTADYCVNNPDKDTLDDEAAMASVAPMSTINLVPFIVFNDSIDVAEHFQARRRLSSVICFALADDAYSGIKSCQI